MNTTEQNSKIIDQIIEKDKIKAEKKKKANEVLTKNEQDMESNPAFMELNKIYERNRKNNDLKHNNKLMKVITNVDFIISSYEKLASNSGANTKGTNPKDTADGKNLEDFKNLAKELEDGTFTWSSIKRVYIPKPGKTKKRPLGIPNMTDKIVQDLIRCILEAIYEPLFQKYNWNHGFRPGKGSLTAMEKVKTESKGMIYAIEGDIKGAYDNVDHKILMNILRKKISDQKFLKLIKDGLEAKIMDNGNLEHSLTGVPQGGIASPILFNIYMHEFDVFISNEIQNMFKEINIKECRSAQYNHTITVKQKNANKTIEKLRRLMRTHRKKIKFFTNKETLDSETKAIQKELKSKYRKEASKRLQIKTMAQSRRELMGSYTRYADDWIILTNADKPVCENIKEKAQVWLKENLGLELSLDKTFITNIYDSPAKFLGFKIHRVKTNPISKVVEPKTGRRYRQNTSIPTLIGIDLDRIHFKMEIQKMLKKTKDGKYTPTHTPHFLSQSNVDIVDTYRRKIIGLINYYYPIIDNKSRLQYLHYLFKYSLLKTLANKEKTSSRSIERKYTKRIMVTQNIEVTNNKTGKKETKINSAMFPTYAESVKYGEQIASKIIERKILWNQARAEFPFLPSPSDRPPQVSDTEETTFPSNEMKYYHGTGETDPFHIIKHRTRTAYSLKLKTCPLCKKPTSKSNPIEMHHLKHLRKKKDSNAKKSYDQLIGALNSKQIPCCKQCHIKIHKGQYNGDNLREIYNVQIILDPE